VTFLLAHLSDAHIGPLPTPRTRDLLGKRLTGYLNWRRRSRIHNMDVLARIVADIHAQTPDHIAMTGDILNIGLPAEFPVARAWLETLGSSQDVSFVPGNHDAYVRSSLVHLDQTFAPWTQGDETALTLYPYVRVRGDVALIGVNSGVPTAPLLASGKLGSGQSDRLEIALAETAARGLMRVVMIHHPPHKKGATPGRGLSDARHFEMLIAKHGAELIIHGHNHRHSLAHIAGPNGPVPIVGVASASAVPGTERHRAAWQMYEITRDGDVWRIDGVIRGMTAGDSDVVELSRFSIEPARSARPLTA
jgi:3',5'-cyclic AMP phosphodiesterase CpdA